MLKCSRSIDLKTKSFGIDESFLKDMEQLYGGTLQQQKHPPRSIVNQATQPAVNKMKSVQPMNPPPPNAAILINGHWLVNQPDGTSRMFSGAPQYAQRMPQAANAVPNGPQVRYGMVNTPQQPMQYRYHVPPMTPSGQLNYAHGM